ncbi:MAG: DUF1569 domain-containing protein [Rhodothermales bacterium]
MQTDRRRFIKSSLVVAVTAPQLVLSGCSDGASVDRKLQYQTLDEGYYEAERLAKLNITPAGAEFSIPQTLVHCAQSIEFSMTGFPEPKSALFQKTVGSAAFGIFSMRGRMSHDLSEPIPGASTLSPEITAEQALQRLRNAIDRFVASQSALKPHFAYGKLTRTEYELAHAMHLANHFSAING